jgi:5-aminopentanamidase
MTTIVCQQLAPRMADLQANRRLSLSAIADAVGTGADIVVLPELVT